MKKIFSLALMAVALLISGQVNAAKVATMVINGGEPQDVEDLTTAIYEVGETANQTAVITLVSNATLNRTTGKMRANKSVESAPTDRTWLNNGENITIDMAGFDITAASLRINIVNAKVQLINSAVKKSNIDASGYTQTFTLYGVSETDDSVDRDACYFKLGKNVKVTGDAYVVCAMYYGSFNGTSISGRPTYGTTIDIDGELTATAGSAMANNGTMSFITGNKEKCPIININKGAKLVGDNQLEAIVGSNASGATGEQKAVYNYYKAKGGTGTETHKNTSAAVYGPGYSEWNIEDAYLAGGVGLYIKSGSYSIKDAEIVATSEEYWEPINYGNGFIGAGSAIVFDANVGYGGDIAMTIEGNTKVTSESGYAIQDIQTNASGTAVTGLEIKSGSFESNAGGDVIVATQSLKDQLNNGTDCKITGGTYGSDIKDYLPSVSGVITPVVNEKAETVYVVGAKPEEKEWVTTIGAATGTDAYVKIEGNGSEEVAADKEVAYLSITGNYAVTVKAGKKLAAGEIVLGENAQIIVEAGAKVVVNGTNGLVAFEPTNLVLKGAAGEATGMFVLNPDVKANKQPWATLEYVSKAYMLGNLGDNEYMWEMFTSPFASISTATREPNQPSIFQHVVDGKFVSFASWGTEGDVRSAQPFELIAITNTSNASTDVKYTFTGQLQGSNDAQFSLKAGFNYLGNGYTALMNAKQVILGLQKSSKKVRTLLYVWEFASQGWKCYNGYKLDELSNVNPLTAFVLYADENADVDMDYEELIWNVNQ